MEFRFDGDDLPGHLVFDVIVKRCEAFLTQSVQRVRFGFEFPGEFFVELGLDIKARSPFGQTMVLELANDSVGYIPTRRAFDEGAYEPESSPYAAGFGEQIADAAVELLSSIAGHP